MFFILVISTHDVQFKYKFVAISLLTTSQNMSDALLQLNSVSWKRLNCWLFTKLVFTLQGILIALHSPITTSLSFHLEINETNQVEVEISWNVCILYE